jgi:YD repeat-containing protein
MRAEFAPDATPADTADNEVERLVYDAAGNTKEVYTRRRDAAGAPYVIRMTYDALNRLRTRTVPEVSYGSSREGIPSEHGPRPCTRAARLCKRSANLCSTPAEDAR